MKNEKINLILIGFGPHSQKTYFPASKELSNVEIKLIIDLKEKEKAVLEYLATKGSEVDTYFIEDSSETIPRVLKEYLQGYIKQENISGVIIATEPLSHIAYADWALEQGLNILMDKPISTEPFVVSSEKSAMKMKSDYDLLLSKYKNQRSKLQFLVNAQRRMHPSFLFIKQKIQEISSQFNIPVTSIQSMHCDGQWRMPYEIFNQYYHPYNVGYGKVSHSGFHIIDIILDFYKASLVHSKEPDTYELFSNFILPTGLLHQMNREDYLSIFGSDYNIANPFSDDVLQDSFSNFGEVDAQILITFLKKSVGIANLSISLMHNGFSRRHWLYPGADLYKGNGRVKHEYHNIQQGPLQNIQVHSYQKNDKHVKNDLSDYDWGGNNHFDIYVFRNNLITKDTAPMVKYSMNDIAEEFGYSSASLISHQVKYEVLSEFTSCIEDNAKQSPLDFMTYRISAYIMSDIYLSFVMKRRKKNPIIKSPFTL